MYISCMLSSLHLNPQRSAAADDFPAAMEVDAVELAVGVAAGAGGGPPLADDDGGGTGDGDELPPADDGGDDAGEPVSEGNDPGGITWSDDDPPPDNGDSDRYGKFPLLGDIGSSAVSVTLEEFLHQAHSSHRQRHLHRWGAPSGTQILLQVIERAK